MLIPTFKLGTSDSQSHLLLYERQTQVFVTTEATTKSVCLKNKRENKKKHFRVDRMEQTKVENIEATVSDSTKENKTEYRNRHFNMFDGQEYDVAMAFDNSLVSAVFDRFGKNYTPVDIDGHSFKWTERVAVCDQFFGWVASFGGMARILGPESVLEQYKEFLIKNLEANK